MKAANGGGSERHPEVTARREKVAGLWEQQFSAREIAERLNVNVGVINKDIKVMRERGVELSPRKGHAERFYCVDGCGRFDYRPFVRCLDCLRAKARREAFEALDEWEKRYGEIPAAHEWAAPSASAIKDPVRRAEIQRRWRERRWPSASKIQMHFGGWNKFLEAAGRETISVGHKRSHERHRKATSVAQRARRERERKERRQK